MKKRQGRLIRYCLSISLIAVLALNLSACSSKPSLSSIVVVPDSPVNIAVGSQQQFTATGTYSNGSKVDISSQATWNSSVPAVASISSSGLAVGLTAGETRITASMAGATGQNITLTVTAIILTSITVTPDSPDSIAAGQAEQFTASGTYSDGSDADITSLVSWDSSDENVATVDSDGLAYGIMEGTTYITAAAAGLKSPEVSLSVTGKELSSITITPDNPDVLTVGYALHFSATGTYSDDSTADITSQVSWNSSDTTVAAINSAGVAAAVAAGTTDITATFETITSPEVILTVENPITTTPPVSKTNTNIYSGTLIFTVNDSQTFFASQSAKSDMTVTLNFSDLRVALNNIGIGDLENLVANYQFSASYVNTGNNVNLTDSFSGTFSRCTVDIAWNTTQGTGIQMAFSFNGGGEYAGTLEGYGCVYPDELVNIDLNSYLLHNLLNTAGDTKTFSGPYQAGDEYSGTLTLVLTGQE